ncbi:copper-translocating P-type ATPase [Coprothermobacter platensis]|uniref:copper-translocating P-type ATPase n=1 Tax=Coprothermobacter platensis TaxID=108819 RepID=UPI000373D9F6|nr:copper-translocating P-type ATPase [Coprothermobacter platensis]
MDEKKRENGERNNIVGSHGDSRHDTNMEMKHNYDGDHTDHMDHMDQEMPMQDHTMDMTNHTGHEMMHSEHGGMNHAHMHNVQAFRQRFWVCLILALPILLLSNMFQDWLGFSLQIPYQDYIAFGLSAVIYFYGGWPFLTGAYMELKEKQPGMMTLIATAITVAFVYSTASLFFIQGSNFFWELASLVVIMLLGHWIEASSVMGASRALEELAKIMPSVAHLVDQSGNVEDIPISHLQKGNLVLVRPGEKVPADGIVAQGESSVDESLLTGESKPVSKTKDDEVIGGSINEEGALTIRVEKTGDDTYLSQMLNMVRQAQQSRSKTQDLADRSAGLLFYIAMGAAILSLFIWAILMNWGFALERAVSVLVIACPHALGLAIPLVIAKSTSIGASKGILIRSRQAFEELKDVRAVVFDKTGTLTEGKLIVNKVVTNISEDDFLRMTSSVEMLSEHSIAKAVVAYAQERGVSIASVEGFMAMPGKGAMAQVDDKKVYVGGMSLLNELDIKLEDEQLKNMANSGKTVIFTVSDGKVIGGILLNDSIRSESYEAVKQLKAMNIKVFMLTGDSKQVAKEVANELGIDDYFAEVLPGEKVEKIKQIKSNGYRVAMVGDGVNDAPALATADIGIAVGAGSDVAIESADIVLVKNNPSDVALAIELSKKTYSKMVQNLWWAAGYNIVTIPLAAGVLYSAGILISPALGALLMSVSTVIVAFNSQTLTLQT